MTIAILAAAVAAYLAWQVRGGAFDTILAPLVQRRRRTHYRASNDADPMQAAADEHLAVMAPRAALAIAIITPACVRYVFAGHVDGMQSRAPDADTRFEIGSITKTFTAALLIALERAGLVRLDMPLDRLLPPDRRLGRQSPAPVTLADLATHCSGLPRLPTPSLLMAGIVLTPRQPYRFAGVRGLWRWLRRRRVRDGQRYRYSNLGYAVLGQALASVAATDYAEALRTRVLEPLGLTRTTCDPALPCAQPHTMLGRGTAAWNLHAFAPAGGLRSTLADMTRWLQANLSGRAPLDARLHAPRASSGENGRRVALAWQVDGEGDRRVVWHNGRTGGSASVIAFAPLHGTGIVVLSNAVASVDRLGLRLLHAAVAAQARNPAPNRPQCIGPAA